MRIPCLRSGNASRATYAQIACLVDHVVGLPVVHEPARRRIEVRDVEQLRELRHVGFPAEPGRSDEMKQIALPRGEHVLGQHAVDQVPVADEVDPLDSGRAVGDAGAGEERIDGPAALVDGGVDRGTLGQVHADRLDPGSVTAAKSMTTTSAPASCASWAAAAPIPVAPPTTTTRLPSYRNASNRLMSALLHGVPNSTGSDVGDRNTCPRMCGSLPVGIEAQVGQAVEQQLERDAHLEPGEVHPEADVDAVAPRDVGLRRAEDVEAVGIRITILVAVGRTEQRHDRRAGGDRNARQLRVAGGHARDDEQRRFPPNRLLDRLRDQRPIGANGVELLGVGEQPEEQVPGRAVRGLDAGGEQQAQEREDLLVGEALAVDLGVARGC